ncbi:peptidoglycan DD-metalloendopeptidase family protein [Bermanella marisrubri]|uniref:Membrane-bound metallopeptidase n=1 Tax=Bermanella marisrubri TaxID=207949 RepID=Q1N4E5_9GAMM|nr:peptidoglycan DD-metalloendopeptidase family protein [Bermanella marisrubri]EAT12920.1 Membrane-bound metallopeptidase [Oceanobacter sp. RED65] [Bermanella marisrubri]QIZ82949.1 peptidoglycan DD-metalloendopeptidase family protein [Bermanella marisrubri]
MNNAVLLTLLLCSLLLSSLANANDDSRQLSETHLKKLRSDITELQDYLAEVKDEHEQLVKSLRKSDEEVAKVSAQVEALKSKLAEERSRLKKLQAQQRTLDQNKRKQQNVLRDILLATYKMGQEPQIKMLLNQQDPAQVTRNLDLLRYFTQAHQQEIDSYRDTLEQVAKNAEQVEAKQQNLQVTLSSLRQQQQKLESKRSEQQKLAKTLNQKISGSGEKLTRLKQDRQKLINLLGKVEEVFLPYERKQESRPFTKLKGQLPNPFNSRPNKMYGMWQKNGKQKWQGWLYKGNTGSDIKAVHHGRVVFSGWLRGYGLLTIVDHGEGYMSLYARNQSLLKAVGDWVETGEVIARMGQSGGYEDTALYFEIRHRGRPQNPGRWLKS